MTVAERALHEMRALVRAIQAELAQEKKKTEQEEHECRTKQTEVKTQQEELDKIARLSDKENTKTQGKIRTCTECCSTVQQFLKVFFLQILFLNLLRC